MRSIRWRLAEQRYQARTISPLSTTSELMSPQMGLSESHPLMPLVTAAALTDSKVCQLRTRMTLSLGKGGGVLPCQSRQAS